MNNSTQAQKGLKTFLLTLSVSLIIFSVIYYFITNSSSSNGDLSPDLGTTKEEQKKEVTQAPQETVFSELAAKRMDNIQGQAVLAGATTSPSEGTQSTTSVPVTGVVGITFGLFSAALMFIFGMFVSARDPRKLAISSFEKKTIRRL